MVCASHAIVYDVVDVNKIIAISSIKLPSYAYAQITAGQKLNLRRSANPSMVNIVSQIPTL